MSGTEGYESVLLVKSEVFVYKIPPRTTNRGFRANEWNLNSPDWNGRMRMVTSGGKVFIKLEDKVSGELFAQCPVEAYPGVAVEPVSDSSRYFVLRIQDDNGRNAFIGVGFADRSDSFDLNVALQDHFKWLKKELDIEQEKESPKPALDLGFKEGETIKINMKITKKDGDSASGSKARAKTGGLSLGGGILPPPPGGVKLPAPPGQGSGGPSPSHQPQQQQAKPQPSPNSNNADWVQF